MRAAIQLAAFALACAVAATSSGADPAAHKEFAGWPGGWVAAYRRFQGYLAARAAHWPRSTLTISADGGIRHDVRIAETRNHHLGAQFYSHGNQILSTAGTPPLFESGRTALFPPGTYAICLDVAGLAGYQRIFPIVWFEVEQVIPGRAPSAPPARSVRTIPPPAPADDFWPNERALAFLDFHLFAGGHRDDIYAKNSKVTPAIRLQVDTEGIIHRSRLDDAAAEKLLRWRVYRDGRLQNRGSVGPRPTFNPANGSGSYRVFVVVEGPDGSLPVSNFLEFPLFPGTRGKLTVIPADRNRDGVPDFLDALPADDNDERETPPPDADADNDGLLDDEEAVKPMPRHRPRATSKNAHLLQLWDAWWYEIEHIKESPKAAPWLLRTAEKRRGQAKN